MSMRRADDPNVWWFGPKWEAPLTDQCDEAPTPVDDACAFCPVPIALGDQGILMRGGASRQPAHLECLLNACGYRTYRNPWRPPT